MSSILKLKNYIYYTVLGNLNAKRKDLIWWFLDTVVHKNSPCLLSEPDEEYARRMKVAVVCIAKDEDHYIDEWIAYHRGLGVDDIFIYQNNWRYAGQHDEHVHPIEFDGVAMQKAAYNHFATTYGCQFDFAAFIDVDEFVCLVSDPDIKMFLSRYREHNALALNWRYFGDNGLAAPTDGNYSQLKRFTKCGKQLDRHIKTIVNFAQYKGELTFANAHFVFAARKSKFTIATDGKSFISEYYFYRYDTSLAWLNHYYTKTFQEFVENKRRRGRVDLDNCKAPYPTKEFYPCNQNDVENTIARDRFLQMENTSRI